MPKVQADRLTRIGAALLRAAGATEEEADAVAVGCVNANLAGHDSHGVIAIPTYIDRIKAGHIVPGAKWAIVQESPTTTVIDGHWGFGFHVNAKAMALTIETRFGEQQHDAADGTCRLPPGAELHQSAELLAASGLARRFDVGRLLSGDRKNPRGRQVPHGLLRRSAGDAGPLWQRPRPHRRIRHPLREDGSADRAD